MPYDKVPPEYDAKSLQKIIDAIQRKQGQEENKRKVESIDMALSVRKELQKINRKINEQNSPANNDQAFQPFTIPSPQGLKIFELITWGWTTIKPFLRFKYWGKVKGYEFFGSQNINFTPQEEPYAETGTFEDKFTDPTPTIKDGVQLSPYTTYQGAHKGTGTVASPDTYLNTEDTDTPAASFIFAPGLNTNTIVLQNVTRSVKGNIDSVTASRLNDSAQNFLTDGIVKADMYAWNRGKDFWAKITGVYDGYLTLDTDIFTTIGETYLIGAGKIPILLGYNPLNRKYQIKATGVEWVAGDEWRIYEYPANKLPSIGAFATFLKRPGNFYVRARTVGKGDTYSDFSPSLNEEPTQSTGLSSSEDLSTPVFVQPIHRDGYTCPIETDDTSVNYGRPMYAGSPVEWADITGGCRETDHWKLFGFEWCHVEIVYNTIPEDDDDLNVVYNVRRTGALWGTPTVDEDVEESELS